MKSTIKYIQQKKTIQIKFTQLILFSILILYGSCKNVNTDKNESIKTNENTTIITNDSIPKLPSKKQIELSYINHSKNRIEIEKIYNHVSHIHVAIAGGAAGYFSPQFNIVNQRIKMNYEELFNNLGSNDTLLNILSLFALEKKGINDNRIAFEKQRISSMNAILEYQFCCTEHDVYLFKEIFDSTTNGALKDLIYRYIE